MYIKDNGKAPTSIWGKPPSAISTIPVSYPLPEERWIGLEYLPGHWRSGFHPISSIRAWWTSRATMSDRPTI